MNDYTQHYVDQHRQAEAVRRSELEKRQAANAQSPSMFDIGARAVAAGALAKFLFGSRGAN